MKTLSNITRYRCDHCGKEYQVGAACKKHEERCTSNPENWPACAQCEFLKEREKMVFYDNDYGYPEERVAKSFFCEKKKVSMYPRKAIHKGLLERYPDTFEGEEVMPKECELFEFGPPF